MTETNTMDDLRRIVTEKLYETLHGKEIDMVEQMTPELPNMLGIVPLDTMATHGATQGTIMDIDHEFWEDYYRDVKTRRGVEEELHTAVRSLREDGILQMTYPYGEDAGIVYVEVEYDDSETTRCAECGGAASLEQSAELSAGEYYLSVSIECQHCDFSRTCGRRLRRL
jgi:hypothetical protein